MREFLHQQSRRAKTFTAGLLILWLSGFVFLFCCEMPKAQAESCPMTKAHNCPEQTKTETALASIAPNEKTLDCCRFLPQVFDKARKIETIQKIETAQNVVKVFQPKFTIVNREFFAPVNFRPVVLSRADARLKNCVFRI